jgi:hypothetical protein
MATINQRRTGGPSDAIRTCLGRQRAAFCHLAVRTRLRWDQVGLLLVINQDGMA